MTWIILSIAEYLLLCSIALFIMCSGHEDGKKAFYDLRHILVALFWPIVLMGHGIWILGKRIFKEKKAAIENNQD